MHAMPPVGSTPTRLPVAVAVILAAVSPAAFAQFPDHYDYYWEGGSGSWNGPNWGSFLGYSVHPGSGDGAFLVSSDDVNRIVSYANASASITLRSLTIDATGSGTMTLNQDRDRLAAETEYIGYDGSGNYLQSGGTNAATFFFVGISERTHPYIVTGAGNYTLTGTGSLSALGEAIGGTFTQTGGTNTVGNEWGGGISVEGTYHQSAGTTTTPGLWLATAGTFNLSGAGILAATEVMLGAEQGGGSFNLSGTGNLSATDVTIGSVSNGLFTQTGGTFTIDNNLSVAQGNNRPGGNGHFSQSGGTVTVNGRLSFGWGSGSGSYLLTGTGSLTANNEFIGDVGAGSFVQTGGTHRVTHDLVTWGSYALSGSGNLSEGNAYIGAYIGEGIGSFAQSGGSHAVEGYLYLGYYAHEPFGFDSIGTYTLSAGSLSAFTEVIGYDGDGDFTQSGGTNTLTAKLLVGYNNGSTSSYTQTAGSCHVNGDLDLGFESGATGTYNLSGTGSLTVSAEHLAYAGSGNFNQSGGTHSVGDLAMGVYSGSQGIYTQSGGTLNVGNLVNLAGHSTFNLDGGTLNLTGSTLAVDTFRIGNAPGSNGSFASAAGQTLTAGEVIIGNAGQGLLTQNGGTHQFTNSLTLGAASGSEGHYLLNQGGLSVAGLEAIGTAGGNGFFSQTGGEHQTQSLYLGRKGSYALADGTLRVTAAMVNSGNFFLSGGRVIGAVTNDKDGLLEVVAGQPVFAARVVNHGQLKLVESITTLDEGLTNHGTIDNAGTLVNDSPPPGPQAATGSILNDGGTFVLRQGGAVAGTGTYFQTAAAGETRVNGTLTASDITLRGGSLTGSGTLVGPVTLGGTGGAGVTVQPGNSTGTLTIDGNLAVNPSTFIIELAGPADFDRLVVTGNASFTHSTVIFRLVGGYAPATGDSFTWLTTGGSASGLGGLNWRVEAPDGAGGFYTWGDSSFAPHPLQLNFDGKRLEFMPGKAADVTATWTTAGSANWADGPKWTCVPGPNVAPDNNGGATTYDAVIAAVGTPYTVAVTSDIAINGLTLNSADATVELQSNTLWAQSGIALANGVLLLNGGTLLSTTVTPTGGSMVCSNNGNNILNGSTLNGALQLNQPGAGHVVRLQNGASFTGNADLGNADGNQGGLGFEQDGALNAKTLNFTDGNGFLSIDGDHTLTFGSGLVARGAGSMGSAHFVGGTSTLVNQGRISADLAGKALMINPSAFINQGMVEALTGATVNVYATTWSSAAGGTFKATGAGSILNFYGTYSNAGDIVLADGTLNLYGNCTTAGLGLAGFSRSGACEVNLSGDLDNTGSTFALTATTCDWTLLGGRIIGGTITEAGGAKLLFPNNGNNRLDGATLAGDLLLNQPGAGHMVRLLHGATFTGDAYLGNADGNQGGFGYEQTGTLNAKTLNFTDGNGFLSIDGTHTLTFGSSLVARGAGGLGSAHFVGGISTLINNGLISADLAGKALMINPSMFTNQGKVEAINGATLTIQTADWSSAAGGTLLATGVGSILNLYGNFSNAGDISLADATLNLYGTCTTTGLGLAGFSRTGACEVNLLGDLDNTGSTFALTATTGDWTLLGGRIIGGTITEAGGAKLLFPNNSNNRLDGATLAGDLLLNQPGAGHLVRLLNGATFTGDAYLGNADGNQGGFGYEHTGTLDGKTLNFTAGNGFLSIDGDHTLTLGPSLVARGAGSIGSAHFVGGTSTLVNQGRITADLAGQTLSINPSLFTNEGIAEALAGATLTFQAADWSNAAGGILYGNGAGSNLNFYGNFSNAGTILLADSTLNLYGTCTTAGLGLPGFNRSGASTVNLRGELNNAGSTFALTAMTGDWTLDGGRITGGTITRTGGANLLFSGNGSNRLDGATLSGDLLLDQPGAGHVVRLQNGATFTGDAYLGNDDGSPGGLGYEQTGTLGSTTIQEIYVTKTLNFVNANAFLSIDGDHTLTFGPNLVARGAGTIGQAHFVGGTSTLVNQGWIYSSSNIGGTLTVNPAVFTNEGGVVALWDCMLVIQATTLTNLQGTTLTAGTWTSYYGAPLWINCNGFASNAAEIYLTGTDSAIFVTPSKTPLEDLLTSNTSAGALHILAGRNYATTNAFSNAGTVHLGGGTFIPASLTNSASGKLFGGGTVAVRPTNSGSVRSTTLTTLTFTNGIQSAGGDMVQVEPGSTLDLSAGAAIGSSADFLVQEGTLVLGTKTFEVGIDYTSDESLSYGNTFDPRANVSGTGAINAVGGTGQTLGGSVSGGATATPVLAFGKVRVGDTPTLFYQINNTGTSGTHLRGAIQTSANGGHLTDPRLSGAGVTAGNFGPILPGGNSGSLAVTFTVSDAGPLTGQTVRLLNNFDNVADQTLSITGGAYRYAAPSNHTPEPVVFGNFHVGATAPSQVLTLSNQAPNDTFSESLNASIGGATGGVTTNGGSFTALAPGASNGSSLAVGIGTSSAGSKNGTATLTLTSNGAGSSGLGLTPLPSQTVTVTGGVYRLAQPSLPGGTTHN
ncbi:MAG: choice-of-anchor D domain-containing protein, partial [Verrucomicrobia bacterium]|nr:choice-of-anchor D domain-containing protein [Verrucomicrobiota bacterium]